VREGQFKGTYRFNLKEQMEQRARILLIGGSQMRRIKYELQKIGEGRVEVVGLIKTYGEVDNKKVSITLRELATTGQSLDKVILGGPSNCLVEHGKLGQRGFWPERKVTDRKNMASGRQEWDINEVPSNRLLSSDDINICLLPLWRVHEIKCMYLAPRTHGLFIT
jgi:hypothetical protein